jgi:hypothetical protein
MKIHSKDLPIIEQMILNEANDTDGTFKPDREGHLKNFIKRRQSILNRVSDTHKDINKSFNAKINWKRNEKNLKKGINQFHDSTKGKSFHRKLNRYNSDRLGAYGRGSYDEHLTKEEFLTAILSLQTHLVIESQFIIPDFDTHLSSCLMIENAMEILEEITRKIRCDEVLDDDEAQLIEDLTA